MGKRMILPEDTDVKIYLEDPGYTLNELLIAAQEKWGDEVDMSKIRVEYEEIQVKCFGYDLYDPADYLNYFILTLEK
jgi:hypothetical protein